MPQRMATDRACGREARRLLRLEPELAARTARLLATAQYLDPDGEMPNDAAIAIRLPEAVVARLDRLAELMEADQALLALVGGKFSRSAVIRLAIVRGVERLEAEYAPERRHG